MSNVADEELVPEQTEGFKVGQKKTIDEYQKLGNSLSHSLLHSFTHSRHHSPLHSLT